MNGNRGNQPLMGWSGLEEARLRQQSLENSAVDVWHQGRLRVVLSGQASQAGLKGLAGAEKKALCNQHGQQPRRRISETTTYHVNAW